MNAFEHGTIRFDEVEIDLSGRRLLIAGSEVALEPKAFSVLALLAQHPGRAFTRDQILDAVWGHRHVTPGVLNRAITLIRHALGESGDLHRYLHTLHGVGYRFDATVHGGRARSAAAEPTSNEPTSRSPSTHAIAQDTTPADAAAASTARAPLPAVDVQPVTAMAPEPPSSSRERVLSTRWLLVALAATALAALLAWLPRRPSPTAAATPPMLVVLPLRAVGGAADENLLAEGLSEELITRLARTEGLRLISQTSSALAQTNKLDLAQLAQQLHVTHALEGSLRQSGQQLRIDLRLIDVPGGRTLWAQDYDRNLADVFAIEREIAAAVGSALALKLAPARNARDEDPLLFRRYLEARQLGHGFALDRGTAIDAFRRLVADAPDYARAHGGLAILLSRQGNLTPELARRQNAEAAAEAERALQLDPSNADANAVLGRLACADMNWERGIELYRRALELAPTDTSIRLTYGLCLGMLGYVEQGLEQAQTAHVADPLQGEVVYVNARLLDASGRRDEAAKYYENSSLPPPTYGQIWFNAVWRGDFAKARTLLVPEGLGRWYASYAAVTAALEDPAKWPQARAQIDASEQPDGLFNWLRVMDPQADVARNIAGLEDAWRSSYSFIAIVLWNRELANHRHAAAFQQFLSRNHFIDYWRAHGFPPQCRADGDGARCD